jgi:acetyl-CoA decarbonylase/synthase complex subunit delta
LTRSDLPMAKPKDIELLLNKNLLEKLAKFQEIELEDVDIELEEIEFSVAGGGGGVSSPLLARLGFEFALIRDSANRITSLLGGPASPMGMGMPQMQLAVPGLAPPAPVVKPTELIPETAGIPVGDYPGSIVEVKLGATKAEGGTRSTSYVIGGEKVSPFFNFQAATPNKPIIALDVFDWPKVPLSKAVKMHFREYLEDTGEWARVCVEKYGAEMINVHLLTIDPLIEDATPKAALKKVEAVLEAVDVPISIGGCGDPQKDYAVFKAICENIEGERLLINSVTLDMDIEGTAKLVNDSDNCVIAFTSMDVNKARELNRKLYDFVPKEQILMDTTTAALGYGLDYAFTVMERCRLAGLKGDPELNHPLSSGTTNAWAAREAWMKMGPEFAPRELRGPIWETVTGVTLLLAGVDYFMMMHPAAVDALKTTINHLMKDDKPAEPTEWVSVRL